MNSRTYLGQYVSTHNMSYLLKKREPLIWTLRRAVCAIFGHKMVSRPWVERATGRTAEVHHGCMRCPHFFTKEVTNATAG